MLYEHYFVAVFLLSDLVLDVCSNEAVNKHLRLQYVQVYAWYLYRDQVIDQREPSDDDDIHIIRPILNCINFNSSKKKKEKELKKNGRNSELMLREYKEC